MKLENMLKAVNAQQIIGTTNLEVMVFTWTHAW